MDNLTKDCIHCGKCTRNCGFLGKYSLDLQGFAEHPELAYHCFLCGQCTRVCPKGIDGREVALTLRRNRVQEAGGKIPEKGYAALLAEKKNYLFRNERKAHKKSVLFPGCNFPSFYPQTTAYLAQLLAEKADMGVLFDCCGKPMAELGLPEDDGLSALKQRLSSLGVEEVVVLCPNCCHFLKPRLDIPVLSIYKKLSHLGLGNKIREITGYLFVPCPDKASRELETALRPFLEGQWEDVPDIPCCGLGGCAAGKEPELAASFSAELAQRNYPNVYTYCASCAGRLSRGGTANVHHVLVDILGTGETPELSVKSAWNRAKFRF